MPDNYAERLWALRPDDEEFEKLFRFAFGRQLTQDERRYFCLSRIALDEDSSLNSEAAAAGS